MLTTCKQHLGVRGHMTSNVFKAQRFAYCDVYVCYCTTVEQRSLLNRSGMCDELSADVDTNTLC